MEVVLEDCECSYTPIEGCGDIPGCMDPVACNYNSEANIDDDTCNGADCLGECDGTMTGPAIVGTDCDDGSENTTNDAFDANCNCIGEPVENNYELSIESMSSMVHEGEVIEIEISFSSLQEENTSIIEILTSIPDCLIFEEAVGDGVFNIETGIWSFDLSNVNTEGNASLLLSFIAQPCFTNFVAEVISIGNSLQEEGSILQDWLSISVPIPLCVDSVTLEAPIGFEEYQWYNNGTLILGATEQTYTTQEIGIYTYDLFDATLGDCSDVDCGIGLVIECTPECTPSHQPITSN